MASVTQALAARLHDACPVTDLHSAAHWKSLHPREREHWQALAAEALAFVREQMPTREEIKEIIRVNVMEATPLGLYDAADALLARLAEGRKG